MPSIQTLSLPRIDLRFAAVIFAAVSVGLPVALISLVKVFLLVTVLLVLLRNGWARANGTAATLPHLWTLRLILVILPLFALTLLWTSAPMSQALGAMGKYGKLLMIPAFLLLIRTPREAALALLAFAGGQMFLLISSWLLYFHVPLVWATSRTATVEYAVFSSYLDQGIMSAVVAAIFWHVKALAPNRHLSYLAAGISLLALGNVFLIFIGRTAYLVGLVMISLAIFWALPKRYRLAIFIAPPFLLVLAALSFENVAQRLTHTKTEITAYQSGIGAATSADNRLDMWKGSLQAIAEKPLTGFGVGSWATEYNRIQKVEFPTHADLAIGSNPHQEYLLWGMQLGIGGIVLLLALMAAMAVDFFKMDQPVARAGLSVLAALALSCLFNSSLYDAYIGDFFCVSLGVLLAYGMRVRHAIHRS